MTACKHKFETTPSGFVFCGVCMRAKEEISAWGGSREGAGRPPELPDGLRTIAFQIDPERMKRLTKFMIEGGYVNRSEALRALIDRTDYSTALRELEELEDCLGDNEPEAGGSIRG